MTSLQVAPQPRMPPAATRALGFLVRRWVPIVLVGLFILGLGIRLYQIDSAPFDFHAARQYRSFIIARDIYYAGAATIPAWQREVAQASAERQGMLEPPVMEFLAAAGYRLLGGEEVWVPRLLSSVAWLLGGTFLFSILRRLTDPTAALVGVAFYLLLPFSVAASRSFQPDPLMVALVIASVWAILRYDEDATYPRLGVAALVSSLAIASQPRALPVVVATFVVMLVARRGLRGSARDPHVLAFLAGAAAVPLIVYGYGLLSGAFRTEIPQAILLPQLWVSPFLWRGWFTNIQATVGLGAFAVALVGVLTFRAGRPMALVTGLWLGYAGFGLVFDYAVATHDYYHLQLVPIVAISIAPVVALVVRHVLALHNGLGPRTALVGVATAAVALALVDARGRIANEDWQAEVAVREEIGAAINHSTRTILLSPDYGTPLEYHGRLTGSAWPLSADLEWERLAGVPTPGVEERFRSSFEPVAPEYFIVEDVTELDRQPELERFLANRFPIIARTDRYAIYDLTPVPRS